VGLLESAISCGVFRRDRRAPERELAQRAISRTTVVSAYRELEARGLLRGYVGRGTFVCAAPDPSGAPFAWRGKIAAAALRSRQLHAAGHRSATHRTRRSCRSRRVSRRSVLSSRVVSAGDRPRDQGQERLADGGHGPTEGQPALREAIAERFGVGRERLSCSPARSRDSICSLDASSIRATR
jgi:DNA-binding transcriptional MocR family regulator